MLTPLDSLQIARSYRLKARAQKRAAGDALKTGSIDRAGHDSMVRAYDTHLRKAEKLVRALRRVCRKELPALGSQLRNLRHRQNELATKASKGKLSAQNANEAGRELARSITEIERSAAALRRALDNDMEVGDGSFVNLPLHEYTAKLGPTRFRRPRKSQLITIRRAVTAAGIVLALAVAITYGGLPMERAKAIFDAKVLPGGNRVAVTCTNQGSEPFQFSAPWKDDTGTEAHFGIQVFVLEQGAPRFQYAPDTEGCWAIEGRLRGRETTARIDPNFSRKAILDSNKLRDIGLNVAKVRLVFVGRGGGELGRFEFSLPPN